MRYFLIPGAPGFFSSYDSSYLKFDHNTLVMHFPNGTQARYGAFSYDVNVRDFQALPVEIKDRNGNFITIVYKDLTTSAGPKKVIEYVTDTAGRRIDFNYQNNRLTSISQDRGGNIFYYVRLDYAPVTIQTRFVAPLTADPSNINGTQVYFSNSNQLSDRRQLPVQLHQLRTDQYFPEVGSRHQRAGRRTSCRANGIGRRSPLH